MNKLYKWCLLSCMAATLSSCNDFLTEENPSGLTADTFYKTESGAEALINSCYTPLRFWYGQEYATSMTELGTDIFTRGNGCAEGVISSKGGRNRAVLYLKITDNRLAHVFINIKAGIFRIDAGKKHKSQRQRADHRNGALLVPA